MRKVTLEIALVLIMFSLIGENHASTMWAGYPSEVTIKGMDRTQTDAYELEFKLNKVKNVLKITNLSAKLYDKQLTIPISLLNQMENPDFTDIGIVSDGPLFSIFIPFGKTECTDTTIGDRRRSLLISYFPENPFDSQSHYEISSRIFNPC